MAVVSVWVTKPRNRHHTTFQSNLWQQDTDRMEKLILNPVGSILIWQAGGLHKSQSSISNRYHIFKWDTNIWSVIKRLTFSIQLTIIYNID